MPDRKLYGSGSGTAPSGRFVCVAGEMQHLPDHGPWVHWENLVEAQNEIERLRIVIDDLEGCRCTWDVDEDAPPPAPGRGEMLKIVDRNEDCPLHGKEAP
jgi:hypothetical protein